MNIYPKHLKMRVDSKRVKALSIERRCDWPEREQPTPTQFQRRRAIDGIFNFAAQAQPRSQKFHR